MRHRRWWAGGVVLMAVALPLAAVGLHRHLIASSVLGHPVLESFETAAEERSWAVLADERRTPGIEPLWLAAMMEEPYRRELILETDLPFHELGALVEEVAFEGQRWPPSGAVHGARWRPTGVTPVLNHHRAGEPATDALRGGLIGEVESPTRVDRARRIWIEVRGHAVAVTVEGGVRRPSDDGPAPHPPDPSEVPAWHRGRAG